MSPTSLATSQDKLSAQIILHALSGHGAPKTLRVTGLIANHQVQIFIDGKSTHNFQQEELVSSLNLCPQNTSTLQVMVGNGEELHCHQVCPGVSVHIQKHDFRVDFHVLPIRGADVVLGMQWLKSLGPVLTDYTTLTMKFIYDGKLIELIGDRDMTLDQISPSQLHCLVDTGNTSSYFHIQMDPHTTTSLPLFHPIPTIQTLLTKCPSLFQPLTTLPPSRPTDHTINLLPNTTPVNVQPYRYPYSQKQEIENQVASMLHHGHIQHSSSPFSSPVLLEKKRDGT